jgi:hypothetical protein
MDEVLEPKGPGSHANSWVGLSLFPSFTPVPEREKRDSQVIIDNLRNILEERNTTVESLQKALGKSEMLCSTLKVSPQVLHAQIWWEV